MNTYKCRAECSADIDRVSEAFNQLNYFECGWETIKMEKLYLKGVVLMGLMYSAEKWNGRLAYMEN